MAEDIWEPIRQGFKDIREGFKEARDSELSKKKIENERIEKAAKQAEVDRKAKRDAEYVAEIGASGEPVFGKNVRLAQAAAAAGSAVTPYKKDKPRGGTRTGGYDYSFMGGKNYKNNAEQSGGGETADVLDSSTDENVNGNIDTAPAIDQPPPQGGGAEVAQTIRNLPAPDTTDFNFSNAKSMSILKNAQKLIQNKESIPNQALADGLVGDAGQAGAASKTIQGYENLLKMTNREISVREKIDEKYQSAVNELYKIDPKATSKVIDNFNKVVLPELQKAGVPVDAIDGRQKDFVSNYLQNLKSSKNEAEAILNTQLVEADVFDKNFKETEKLYRFAATTDKDHLISLIKDPNVKPYEQNVLISALITRMMQDQIESNTGRNMSVMSPEEIDLLYTPATPAMSTGTPALNVEEISKSGERMRQAAPQSQKKSSPTIQTQNKEVPGTGFRPIRR
jgi:hypothetical protein